MQRSVVHMYMPAFVARSCTALPEEKSKASYPYLILVKLISFEETFDQTKLLIIHRLNCGQRHCDSAQNEVTSIISTHDLWISDIIPHIFFSNR